MLRRMTIVDEGMLPYISQHPAVPRAWQHALYHRGRLEMSKHAMVFRQNRNVNMKQSIAIYAGKHSVSLQVVMPTGYTDMSRYQV